MITACLSRELWPIYLSSASDQILQEIFISLAFRVELNCVRPISQASQQLTISSDLILSQDSKLEQSEMFCGNLMLIYRLQDIMMRCSCKRQICDFVLHHEH